VKKEQTVIKRKKNWIGHVMRNEGLMKDVMEGETGGKIKSKYVS